MPKKSTDDPIEESVTEDHEEGPIIEDSKRNLPLRILNITRISVKTLLL